MRILGDLRQKVEFSTKGFQLVALGSVSYDHVKHVVMARAVIRQAAAKPTEEARNSLARMTIIQRSASPMRRGTHARGFEVTSVEDGHTTFRNNRTAFDLADTLHDD
jgi:hypothetical protein